MQMKCQTIFKLIFPRSFHCIAFQSVLFLLHFFLQQLKLIVYVTRTDSVFFCRPIELYECVCMNILSENSGKSSKPLKQA